MTCIFCQQIKEDSILYQTENFKVVWDIDPIQSGHLLVISKGHYDRLGLLPVNLRHELVDLEAFLTEKLCEQLPIDGVTMACNDGVFDAGTHFHVHLIPRFHSDGFWDTISPKQVELDLSAFLGAL